MTPDLQRKYAEWASRQNELSEIARSWDLWGGAAFVLFVLWLAVSSVFSLS